MKLTKPQFNILFEINERGSAPHFSRYKPCLRLLDLGLIERVEGGEFRDRVVITEAGKEVLREGGS